MERVFDIDSLICQANFPKWSECFPERQSRGDGNDIATTRAYMPRHDSNADYDHDIYHLGYPGAVGRGIVVVTATRFRVA